jgi:SAM-dependent methyltransferase
MFTVTGDEYDRFMGRYSMALAPVFASFAGVGPAMRVLDVGCGTGALTAELVKRAGAGGVAATDPADQFVMACRARAPGADVRHGPGEHLPWSDGEFDRVLSQLVLPFFEDATASLAEMRRVARKSGTVAACMWGAGDEMELIGKFWRAAAKLDPGAPGDRVMRYRTRADTEALFRSVGFSVTEAAPLDVTSTYADFEELWKSLEGAAGTVGAYVAKLDPPRLAVLREACRRELGAPDTAFTLRARAWAVKGTR